MEKLQKRNPVQQVVSKSSFVILAVLALSELAVGWDPNLPWFKLCIPPPQLATASH